MTIKCMGLDLKLNMSQMVQPERLLRAYLRDIRRNLIANVYRLYRQRSCIILFPTVRAIIQYNTCILMSPMTVRAFNIYALITTVTGRMAQAIELFLTS